MKTITASAARKLGKFLANDFREIFGSTNDELAERLGSLARITIDPNLRHGKRERWFLVISLENPGNP